MTLSVCFVSVTAAGSVACCLLAACDACFRKAWAWGTCRTWVALQCARMCVTNDVQTYPRCNSVTLPPHMLSATSSSHPTSRPPLSPSPGTTRWRKPPVRPLTSCSTATCPQKRVGAARFSSGFLAVNPLLCCYSHEHPAARRRRNAHRAQRRCHEAVTGERSRVCTFHIKCLSCPEKLGFFPYFTAAPNDVTTAAHSMFQCFPHASKGRSSQIC
jgi:hypothetical protein